MKKLSYLFGFFVLLALTGCATQSQDHRGGSSDQGYWQQGYDEDHWDHY